MKKLFYVLMPLVLTVIYTDDVFSQTLPSMNGTRSITANYVCPLGSPIDCGNGYWCSLDYPICGYGVDVGKCFSDGGNGGGPCLSGMLYGEHSHESELLRQFRDNVLSKTQEGQQLIKLYYQWSPIIVKAMEADEEFKEDVKEMVDEVLGMVEVE